MSRALNLRKQAKRTNRVRLCNNLRNRKASGASRALKILRAHSRFTRRRFLAQTAGAGLVLGLAPKLGGARPGNVERRTLFFNLSGETLSPDEKHFFHIGGRTYELQKVSQNPRVLAEARESNSFLRAVPDDQITHHLENAVFSSDITPLGYIYSTRDPQGGTWSMSMIVQALSPAAVSSAYARIRQLTSDGPLPLSAKRDFYGIDPAFAEQDLREEQDLIDYTDGARTLIALHPDLLCADPGVAQYIANKYTSAAANSGTRFLAGILKKGPATPQTTPDQPNPQGWATLIPLNQDDGTPFKMTNGLNQYFPDWSTEVDQQVRNSVNVLHRQVKNDTYLGTDITGLVPATGIVPPASNQSLDQELTGKVWYRHDGVTAVDHGSTAFRDAPAPQWDFQQKNGEMGLMVTQPAVEVQSDRSVKITLNNVSNWFLRFLGMYLQFVDRDGNVIPASQLPADTIPGREKPAVSLDRGNALFAGIVPPVFSVAGVPIYPPGQASVIVNMPPAAGTIKVFYGGIGYSGSPPFGPDIPPDMQLVGGGMTAAINWGVVAFFMVVGVSEGIDPVVKLATSVIGQIIANELIATMGAVLHNPNTAAASIAFIKGLLNGVAGKGLAALAGVILERMAAAQLIDAVPAAGQIARAAAAFIGGIQLAETTIEVAISPPIYQFDLTFTHNLSLNISPDEQSGSFPPVPPGYALYYKINYLFDNGSPHYLDGVDVPDPNVKSIPIKLTGIPWGGRVNVSVGFYVRKQSTPESQNDWCAGKGTTGLVSNTVDQLPNIVIQQIKVPIQKDTVYIHTSKITLDASGRHLWTATPTPPPYVPPSAGQQPGDLAGFRSITVRQATRTQAGYVGYAWQSYGSGVRDCQAGVAGQLDQAANLNTDMGNRGANAQNGYATTPCGLQGGASSGIKLAYNLLTDSSANFYLDTSSLLLREVQLDPAPGFISPMTGRSFGKLNLDSSVLLLHPAGHVVSVNNANHKFEALKLPTDAVDDTVAQKRLLARTYSGQGSRPGLMTSPVGACISAEGVILILEDSTANNRIQAFDLGGNPVSYFKQQQSPYFLSLPATAGAKYLDFAIEFTGYLYILSQSSDSGSPVFRLDIYHPAQSDTQPICTTRGMNAAKLTVDFWRNVYTLNYEVLKLPSGQIPAMTEPSVSFWVPPPPVA